MDLRLLRSKKPREKLNKSASDVSIGMDEGDQDELSLYYIEMDVDEEKKRRETDKKKRERTREKMKRGQEEKLQNGLRDGMRIRQDGDGILKDSKKIKNKRTKKQQEEDDKEQEVKNKEKQKKESKRKKTTENLSEYEVSLSEEDVSMDEELASGGLNSEDLEKLTEAVEKKKKLISTLRVKPWPMRKKLYVLRKSQAFIEKYEGILSEGSGRKFHAYKIKLRKKWMKFQRNFKNFKAACIPWETKIKEIESRYGSSAASYFKLQRWMFGVNFILFCLNFGLIMLPEALMGMPYGSIPRKTVSRKELPTALNIEMVWDIEGYMKYSVFFCGYYNNEKTIGWLKYHMPLSYLLVGLGSIVYSYIVVIKAMAGNASLDSGSEDANFNYSWRIFTSWDYLIGNSERADSKFASIATTLKEALADEQEMKKDDNDNLTWLLRVVANLLILGVLTGSGYLIYYVVYRSERFIRNGMENYGWWERNEVNVVMALLTVLCPMLFESLSQLEGYHPRVALRWQLGRVFALYLGNIYSFLIAITDQILIMREEEEELKHNLTMWEASQYNRTTTGNYTTPIKVDPADVPRGPCWETVVGQEFVRMLLTDTMTVYGVVVLNDLIRAVLVRFLNHCCCWDLEYTFPGYAEFDVSGNVLTLIFNQGVIWTGTFYAPCLPGLNLIRLQSCMYLQAWAIKCCNIPQSNVFNASNCNHIYMIMLLVILFLSTVPTIFTIVTLRPSFDCGPYSGKNRMYDIIWETVQSDFPAWFAKVFSHISNPGLVLSFLLFLVLTIYYLHATSNTYKQTNIDLRKKLHAQMQDNRSKTKLMWMKTNEYLEQAKSNGEAHGKQNKANIPEEQTGGDSENNVPSFSQSCPGQGFCTGPGSSYTRYQTPPYTRPPAPQSYLVHGQVPGPPAP